MNIEPQDAQAKASVARTAMRVALDFTLGMALFGVALCLVSLGHGPAFAGAAGWVTTVVPEQASSLVASDLVSIHTASHHGALVVLALTFGAVTALNMSVARHLRTVAIPAHNSHRTGH